MLALGNVKEAGALVDRPKALGDIRGVTYIYGMFYRFGLIDVPDEAKQKMKKERVCFQWLIYGCLYVQLSSRKTYMFHIEQK